LSAAAVLQIYRRHKKKVPPRATAAVHPPQNPVRIYNSAEATENRFRVLAQKNRPFFHNLISFFSWIPTSKSTQKQAQAKSPPPPPRHTDASSGGV
jgi:hypothetical protein